MYVPLLECIHDLTIHQRRNIQV